MPSKKHFLLLIIAIFCVAPVYADWADRFDGHKLVYLSEILENPESWREIPVRIPLRFQAIRDTFNPFFTAFGKDEYMNFSAWDLHSKIWTRKGFRDDYPFFYMSKHTIELQSLHKLKTFDTVMVLANVSGIFKGRPYFRIVWIKKLPGELGVNNLSMLHSGFAAYEKRQFDKAMSIFAKAFATNPPRDIKALLHKATAKIYLYGKYSYQDALDETTKGLLLTKADPELLYMLKQCRYHLKHGGKAVAPAPIVRNQVEAKKKSEKFPTSGSITSSSGSITDEPSTADKDFFEDDGEGDDEIIIEEDFEGDYEEEFEE